MERQVMVQYDDGMRQICRTAMDLALHVGDWCISGYKGCQDYGRVAELYQQPAVEDQEGRVPVVVRCATLQDQAKAAENAVHGRMAAATCRRMVETTKCEMHLLHARYNFDRSLLIVSFSAEDRVDFRELLKLMTDELGVRIEMRQVGVRDAARQTGGMGPCGRMLCCHQWMRKFEAVNVKMAKVQNISLSSTNISGMCGRLKCCLRHEHDAYLFLGAKVPQTGSRVQTPEGQGIVIDRDLMRGVVTVRMENQGLQRFAVDAVQVIAGPRRQRGGGEKLSHENSDSERS